MSVNASIKINLNKLNCNSIIDVIKTLINAGWTIIHNGKITYSLLDKQGDVDFRADRLTLEELAEIIEKKSSSCDLITIELTWKDSYIGGPLAFSPSEGFQKITLCLEAARQQQKLTPEFEITDFQWYLKRLLPCLDATFGVESFSFEQHR
jgi:hypothetical protein